MGKTEDLDSRQRSKDHCSYQLHASNARPHVNFYPPLLVHLNWKDVRLENRHHPIHRDITSIHDTAILRNNRKR